MFKELIAAWRGKNTLSLMLDQFDQMLAHDRWMFDQAIEVYWHNKPWPEVQDALYARDKQVNELERAIRREVVRHLTIYPGRDVVACLTLMSVVKDAERIGDYSKNIFEIGKVFGYDYSSPVYGEPLQEVHVGVVGLFDMTRQAFRDSNAELACNVHGVFGRLGKKCDHLIEQLLRQKGDMPTDEAVAYGLLCRHMKRIGAHLSNIASSVTSPIESLDFMDEAAEVCRPKQEPEE